MKIKYLLYLFLVSVFFSPAAFATSQSIPEHLFIKEVAKSSKLFYFISYGEYVADEMKPSSYHGASLFGFATLIALDVNDDDHMLKISMVVGSKEQVIFEASLFSLRMREGENDYKYLKLEGQKLPHGRKNYYYFLCEYLNRFLGNYQKEKNVTLSFFNDKKVLIKLDDLVLREYVIGYDRGR